MNLRPLPSVLIESGKRHGLSDMLEGVDLPADAIEGSYAYTEACRQRDRMTDAFEALWDQIESLSLAERALCEWYEIKHRAEAAGYDLDLWYFDRIAELCDQTGDDLLTEITDGLGRVSQTVIDTALPVAV